MDCKLITKYNYARKGFHFYGIMKFVILCIIINAKYDCNNDSHCKGFFETSFASVVQLVFEVWSSASKRVAPRQSDYVVVTLVRISRKWNGNFILSLILDLALENSF